MKKNKKLELKKETITILDKLQADNIVGGHFTSNNGCEFSVGMSCDFICQQPSKFMVCNSINLC